MSEAQDPQKDFSKEHAGVKARKLKIRIQKINALKKQINGKKLAE